MSLYYEIGQKKSGWSAYTTQTGTDFSVNFLDIPRNDLTEMLEKLGVEVVDNLSSVVLITADPIWSGKKVIRHLSRQFGCQVEISANGAVAPKPASPLESIQVGSKVTLVLNKNFDQMGRVALIRLNPYIVGEGYQSTDGIVFQEYVLGSDLMLFMAITMSGELGTGIEGRTLKFEVTGQLEEIKRALKDLEPYSAISVN